MYSQELMGVELMEVGLPSIGFRKVGHRMSDFCGSDGVGCGYCVSCDIQCFGVGGLRSWDVGNT